MTPPINWHKIDGTKISGVRSDTHTILVHGLFHSPVPLRSFSTIEDIKCCTYRIYIEHNRLEVFAHEQNIPIYSRNFAPKHEPTRTLLPKDKSTIDQIIVEVNAIILLDEL